MEINPNVKNSDSFEESKTILKGEKVQTGLSIANVEKLTDLREKLGWAGRLLDKRGRVTLKKFITAMQCEIKALTTDQLQLLHRLVIKPKTKKGRVKVIKGDIYNDFLTGEGRLVPTLTVTTPLISHHKALIHNWKRERLRRYKTTLKNLDIDEMEFHNSSFIKKALKYFWGSDSNAFPTLALCRAYKESKSKRGLKNFNTDKWLKANQSKLWRSVATKFSPPIISSSGSDKIKTKARKPRTTKRRVRGVTLKPISAISLIDGGLWSIVKQARNEDTIKGEWVAMSQDVGDHLIKSLEGGLYSAKMNKHRGYLTVTTPTDQEYIL